MLDFTAFFSLSESCKEFGILGEVGVSQSVRKHLGTFTLNGEINPNVSSDCLFAKLL